MDQVPGHKKLSLEEISNVLSKSKSRAILTEPREIGVFYKLNHLLREQGCDNPNCQDPRPADDAGRHIVIELNGKYMCRFCFLAGWLSESTTASKSDAD